MNKPKMYAEERRYRKEIAKSSGKQKSIDTCLRERDREGLISYFLPNVLEISEQYRADVGSQNFMDMVGVGNEALVKKIYSGEGIFFTNALTHVKSAVQKAIVNHVLKEEVESDRVDYRDESVLSKSIDGYAPIDRLDREALEPLVFDSLRMRISRNRSGKPSKRMWEVYCLKIGLDREDGMARTSTEVSKILGDNYQSQASAEHRIAELRLSSIGYHILSKDKMEKNRMILSVILGQSRKNKYRGLIDPNQEKLISELQSYKLIEEYFDILTNSDISTGQPAPSSTNRRGSRIELEDLRNIFMERYNKTMEDFQKHYILDRDRFARFISENLGDNAEYFSRLIELSESEKKAAIMNDKINMTNIKDVKTLRKALNSLNGAIEKKEDKELVREYYFPLFAIDSKRCLEAISVDAGHGQNSERAKELFLSAGTYFSRVKEMTIERIKTKLDDFQKVDIEIMSARHSNIIASEMGTGKSLEAIAYAIRNKLEKVLIVSTKSGASATWPDELNKHLEMKPNFTFLDSELLSNERLANSFENSNWFLTTYTTATSNIDRLRSLPFNLIILDECHKVNHQQSLQSQALLTLDANHKLAISGSLFKNSRNELFPVLNWLYPIDFPDKGYYIRKFCLDEEGLFRLQYEMSRRMVLRTQDQVLRLNPTEQVNLSVKMNRNQSKEYRSLENDFIKWYRQHIGEMEDPNVGFVVLKKLHTLRRKAIEPKISLIEEIVNKSVLKDGNKAVVYSTYIDNAMELRERFSSLGPCYIEGRSSNQQRVQMIKDFNEDQDKKVFIITAAGGESIDLTPASDFIYVNKPLTRADEKQALYRVLRRGQKKNVRVFNVVTEESVEERIEDLLAKKEAEYQRVMHDPKTTLKWFEENERENIESLIGQIIRKSGTEQSQ